MFGGLIDGAIACLVVIGLSIPIKAREQIYFDGLKAVVAAYVIEVLFFSIFHTLPGPQWLVAVVLAPLIEESCRYWFARRPQNYATPSTSWLFFGAGFGLFEGVLKVFGILAGETAHQRVTQAALVPIVPILLHIFLSAVMCRELRKGRPGWFAVSITLALHMTHNWWAFNQAHSYGDVWGRAALLLFGVVCVVLWARRGDPVTSPLAHANTPA